MNPTLEVIWRSTDGSVHLKILKWSGPTTDADLADYMQNYFEMVLNGYRPSGYAAPPMPHCARLKTPGKVLAEWHRKESPAQPAESQVTAGSVAGDGGCSASDAATRPPQHTVRTLPLDLENGGTQPESFQSTENARPEQGSGQGYPGTERTDGGEPTAMTPQDSRSLP